MDFPQDIIVELLLRLPVKSVMRFKCVSKSWNYMISDSAFRRSYQSRYGTVQPSGFFYHRNRPESLNGSPSMSQVGPAKFLNTSSSNIELREDHDLNKLGYILAASKGLLLLSRNPMSYHVYDIVSKKHFTLPKVLKKYPYVAVGFICYDHNNNNNFINSTSTTTARTNNGNSHDHRLRYKVVRIGTPFKFSSARRETFPVETYSSETGKWKISKMKATSGFYLGPNITAKVIGGVFHWWGYCHRIVAYNPDDPEGRVILIQLPWDRQVDCYFATEFEGTQDGCLQFVTVFYTIEVWVLKGKHGCGSYLDEDVVDRSQWILAHKISFVELGVIPEDFGPNSCGVFFPWPVAISPWNSGIIFLRTPNKILSYDHHHRKIEVVCDYHFDVFPGWFVHFEWPIWPCL